MIHQNSPSTRPCPDPSFDSQNRVWPHRSKKSPTPGWERVQHGTSAALLFFSPFVFIQINKTCGQPRTFTEKYERTPTPPPPPPRFKNAWTSHLDGEKREWQSKRRARRSRATRRKQCRSRLKKLFGGRDVRKIRGGGEVGGTSKGRSVTGGTVSCGGSRWEASQSAWKVVFWDRGGSRDD